MISGENSESIPSDLVIEILLRLPAKSIARCRCVSKLWGSMLLSPYFTELFLTKSSPRLLFAVRRLNDDWCFLTCPQLQNVDEKPSSLTADFQMKFSGLDTRLDFCGFTSGFILFCRRVNDNMVSVICNPSTGQCASLPPSPQGRMSLSESYLGFDPIDKQFKILSINILVEGREEANQILTLGTGKDSWRKIHCPLKHSPTHFGNEICINGVLYYSAVGSGSVIVCFNVRSEKFKFISIDYNTYRNNTKLINHKGNLGVITLEDDYSDGNHCFKLCMSVIKDSEKPEMEWTKYYFPWVDGFVDSSDFFIVGVTVTSEIVLSMRYAYEPFSVIYINLERGTFQKVEIQGLKRTHLGNYGRVEVFTDYVENLNFITMMMKTTTSTSPPELKRNPVTTLTSSKPPQQNGRTTFESINKFDSLRLLDDDGCT